MTKIILGKGNRQVEPATEMKLFIGSICFLPIHLVLPDPAEIEGMNPEEVFQIHHYAAAIWAENELQARSKILVNIKVPDGYEVSIKLTDTTGNIAGVVKMYESDFSLEPTIPDREL